MATMILEKVGRGHMVQRYRTRKYDNVDGRTRVFKNSS